MNIVNGILASARYVGTNNCNHRPHDEISLIVIHCISLPLGHFGNDYVEQLFCNTLRTSCHRDFSDLAETKVSAHVYIRRDGTLIQFVPFTQRAWHAGVSSFEGRDNCNDFSVGIEMEGTDTGGYSDVQYSCLAEVCRSLSKQYGIPVDRITGHSDIAPGRKTDPGAGFDWPRLRRLFLSSVDVGEAS